MIIRKALAAGTARLKRALIDTPSLDASLLLAEVLKLNTAALIAAGPEPLSGDALRRFGELLERRAAGECTAYILKRKEFRGMEFTVSPAVLVPRPDTETLVETALDWIQRRREIKNPGLLDLCTGSGAVAVSLKKESPGLKVLGSDISAEALKIAELNAAALLKPERGETPLTFIQSDLFQCIRGRFRLITVNPPYIPAGEIEKLSAEVRGEPRIALDGGEDGLALIRLIIEAAPDYLLPGGGLLMEIDPPQARTVPALLAKAGFQDIQIYRDLSGRDRVAGAVQPG